MSTPSASSISEWSRVALPLPAVITQGIWSGG
jgi:hypothetical protein